MRVIVLKENKNSNVFFAHQKYSLRKIAEEPLMSHDLF